MKKKLKITDFPVVVPWQSIESIMTKRQYKKFQKFMYGQTCMPEGVYPEDLDRFLRDLPVID